MSDEHEPNEPPKEPGQAIGGLLQALLGGAQATPTEVLENTRKAKNIAAAMLPMLRDIRRQVRDVEVLHAEAPMSFMTVQDRLPKLRRHLALMIDTLEGVVER